MKNIKVYTFQINYFSLHIKIVQFLKCNKSRQLTIVLIPTLKYVFYDILRNQIKSYKIISTYYNKTSGATKYTKQKKYVN